MRILTANLGWKLFSLALAAGLWFAFVAETETAMSIAVPVEFRNLPKDLEISSDLADRMYLKVHGPSARMKPSDLAESLVILNLASVVRPGEQTFTFDQSTVELPAGVIMTRAIPSQIRLKFESRLIQSVRVEPRFAGPPSQGYTVVRQEVSPRQLRITGPESRVQQVTFVQTDPIDLTGTVSNGEFRVSAYVSDPQVRFESSPIVIVRVMLEKIPLRQN